MLTIRDIAKEANVSMTTVSYVLNDSGSISDETRQRVREIAKRLGYRPSAAARSLKSRRTGNIGVFLPGFAGPVFSEVLQAIYNAISVRGYEILVCSTQLSERLLLERHVDGAIILNSFIKNNTIELVQSSDYPVVVMERYIDMPHVSCVLVDNFMGGYLAAQLLIESGRTKIALIVGHPESHENNFRINGAKKAILDAGIDLSECPIVHGGFSEEGAGYAMSSIIEEGNGINGVFCINDEMAVGAIKFIRQSGLSVPRDISVIGFDDIPASSNLNPSITTVRIDKVAWGHHAGTTLIDMIENTTTGRYVKLPISLVTRQSTCSFLRSRIDS